MKRSLIALFAIGFAFSLPTNAQQTDWLPR
jgi:hypothetical protein